MHRTKILMCNARLFLAKKKTEICLQKALSQNIMSRLLLSDRDRAVRSWLPLILGETRPYLKSDTTNK